MDLIKAAHTRASPLACKRSFHAFHILLDDVMSDHNRLVNKCDEFEECMLEVRKCQRVELRQQDEGRKRRRVSNASAANESVGNVAVKQETTEHLPDAIQSQRNSTSR
jgi:hypothetical protein